MSSLDSFTSLLARFSPFRGGGRRASQPDQDALDFDLHSYTTPSPPSQARLTLVQITDVYTLDNFASLKTLLQHVKRAQGPHEPVVSMLTGDFLAPYLLSSVDRGAGMMNALKKTPIDILTWGNHEADIAHRTVCKHVQHWTGDWINSNMQSHEAMKYQIPFKIIEIPSADGTHTRKVGLVAVLSNDPKLYSQFKAPGAFGGATIEDPWETLRKYDTLLKQEYGCDIVIPLEHLYVHENEKTCRDFDFPLILSGHDHHRMDQVLHGTRVIKPGMDGVYASVVELVWPDATCTQQPKIRSSFVRVADYEPCPNLKAETDAAYDVLLPLRNTQLASILPTYMPLSSQNARGQVCTMGRLICSMLKAALEQTVGNVDAAILMGGNIRANEAYPDDAFFSLETLEAEIKPDEVVGFVQIPGRVLAAGIEATHAGDPIPGWFQYDDGIKEDLIDGVKRVTIVAGKRLDPERLYRVATKIKDLTNGQSPPLKEYFTLHPEFIPSKGSYYNIHSELMGFFARGLFRKLWDATGELMQDPEEVLEEISHPPPPMEKIEGRCRLAVLDRDGDGVLTVDDIHYGLRDFLGLSVVDEVKTLAEAILECADLTGDGRVSVKDFEIFCQGMPKEHRLPRKWSDAFPDPMQDLSSENTSMDSDEEVFPMDIASGMRRGDTAATALSEFSG